MSAFGIGRARPRDLHHFVLGWKKKKKRQDVAAQGSCRTKGDSE